MEEGRIKSFPMKGTIDATLPHAESILLDDAKEAAEHATIGGIGCFSLWA